MSNPCQTYAYLNQDAPTGFTNNWLTDRHSDRLFSKRYGDFPTYYEHEGQDNTTYRDILKTIQERTPVSDLFFSKRNVDHVKYLLAKLIRQRYGYVISPEAQSSNEILIVMRSMYLQYAVHAPDNIKQQVADLNLNVITDLFPRMVSNIQMQLTYQRDQGSQPLPMARPVNVSSAGTRSNRSVTDLFI